MSESVVKVPCWMCQADATIPRGHRKLSKQWERTPLRRHMLVVHSAKAVAKRKRKLEVDGQGYLRAKLFNDSASIDLSAITRFQKALLNAEGGLRVKGLSRLQKLDMTQWADDPGWESQPITLPKKLLALIYRMAYVAGTGTKAVHLVLLAYGLEKAADELRRAKRLPDPHTPQIFPPTRQKEDAA